jgi:DNA-binding NtrC family response regulator
MAPTVGLIGLSPALRDAFRERARALDQRVVERESELALAAAQEPLALCVAELGGSDSRVLEQVRSLAKLVGRAPLVVLARNLGAELGAGLIRLGVADVIDLPNPIDDVIARSLRSCARAAATPIPDPLLGETAAIRAARQSIQQIAATRATVLLLGETGTGKDAVAREMHRLSPLREAQFHHVACGSLTREDLERGARGTLYLDEIADADATAQARILRLLQLRDGPPGDAKVAMGARVIASTSADLWRAVRENQFRRDLYFRLSNFEIRLPSLRERRSDVPALARAALERAAATLGVAPPRASDGFYRRLLEHDWPGNLRELHNVIERLLVEGQVALLDAADLDAHLPAAPRGASDPDLVAEYGDAAPEAARIARVLAEVGGNVSRATRRLGIARTTLRRRIEEFGLERLIPKD